MLSALVLLPSAHAWLGNDGVYDWSASGAVDPDAPTHVWVDVPSYPGAIQLGVSSVDDDTESLAALGAQTFRFYGFEYGMDAIWVSSNGLLVFDASGSYVQSYCCSGESIPTPQLWQSAIAAFWTDLNPLSGGEIWAVATPSETVVSWVGVQFYGVGGSISVQVGLRPDGSFRISLNDQQGTGNPVAIGHQRDLFTGNGVFAGMTAPFPKTWLFVPDAVDDDGDGYTDVDDCDDSDPAVHPGAVDTACDGVLADCIPSGDEDDDDGDGSFVCDGDCDDTWSLVYPGAPELCDQVDNDCNGMVDENLPLTTYYVDLDFDGWGDVNGATLDACGPFFGYGPPGDCDDTDWSISPWQSEDCDPNVDRNCDGDPTLDAYDQVPYRPDADGDGYGPDPELLTCVVPPDAATQSGVDCDDAESTAYPGAPEGCDGIDNDCDGLVDDDDPDVLATTTYHPDDDGDGYGSASDPGGAFCTPPSGWVTDATDCDDAESTAYPGAPEACDGIDNDCDGLVDDDDPDVIALLYYPDADGDGRGDANATGVLACVAPSGMVDDATDCDDSNATVSPGQIEACPDGIDNDCDGLVDADDPDYTDQGVELWFDQDGDGVGTPGLTLVACSADVLPGYVSPGFGTDCNDGDPTVSPNEPEVCDNVDNDCDNQVDEGSISSPYYPDADLDGYGDSSVLPVLSCLPVPGAVNNGNDCDDTDPAINPVATETCDGVDENCSGIVDDGLPMTTWYIDADDDGYGDADDAGTTTCATLTGHVTENTDCDDAEPDVNPGVDEIPDDGIDNDCDGVATDTPVVDSDRDGIPDPIDPDPLSDGDVAPPADPDPDFGCGGCASGAPASGLWALGLGLLALRRR
ncbi:MAG: putative metal-binding motif-containing protein [Alphaproteobacteria bacterium]|nr:putative metal-binding motif-containing protein [Alphaproteobacteria bacterium]